jgi:hypothetical protein
VYLPNPDIIGFAPSKSTDATHRQDEEESATYLRPPKPDMRHHRIFEPRYVPVCGAVSHPLTDRHRLLAAGQSRSQLSERCAK